MFNRELIVVMVSHAINPTMLDKISQAQDGDGQPDHWLAQRAHLGLTSDVVGSCE